MSEQEALRLYGLFLDVEKQYRAAVVERYDASETLSESIAMAHEVERQATIRKAITTGNPPGKNAEERAASIVMMLDSDDVYTSLVKDAYEHRATAADVQRRIDMLDDEIKGLREHMRILANLAASAGQPV